MNKLYVGFVLPNKGQSFNYDAIQWFFNAKAVHIFIAIGETLETSTVFQTTKTLTSSQSFQTRKTFAPLEVYEVLDGSVDHALEWCVINLGVQYDYPGIVGLGFILLLEKLFNLILYPLRKLGAIDWVNIHATNPLHMNKWFYCSEYVVEALKAAKVSKIYDKPNTMAPEQRQFCIDNPDVYKRVL